MAEIKYDIRRGADIYREIYGSRLRGWISKGVIKRGEATVWRSGLSGWRKPEELEELIPFFEEWEKQQLKRKRPKKRKLMRWKKKIKDILVIDDEKDLCRLLDRVLSSKGYRIVAVNTKREAITCLGRSLPDVVFLDLKLPDGDGMSLLSKIKKIAPKTVVNIISAYGSEEKREEAKRKGVDDFIDKPFTEKEILRSIKVVS